jgi:hypothetical protein
MGATNVKIKDVMKVSKNNAFGLIIEGFHQTGCITHQPKTGLVAYRVENRYPLGCCNLGYESCIWIYFSETSILLTRASCRHISEDNNLVGWVRLRVVPEKAH